MRWIGAQRVHTNSAHSEHFPLYTSLNLQYNIPRATLIRDPHTWRCTKSMFPIRHFESRNGKPCNRIQITCSKKIIIERCSVMLGLAPFKICAHNNQRMRASRFRPLLSVNSIFKLCHFNSQLSNFSNYIQNLQKWDVCISDRMKAMILWKNRAIKFWVIH